VALLVLAAMIRDASFYLMLFLLLPLAVHRSLTGAGARVAAHLGLAVLLAGAAIGLDAIVYAHDDGWRLHREYNRVRSELHDRVNPAYGSLTRSSFDAVGWSENDLRMFSSWFFAHRSVFSLQKLASLRGELESASHLGARYRGARRLAGQVAGTGSYALLALASLALSAALAIGGGRAFPLLVLGVAASALAAGAYLALLWRLPERVALPILFAASASFLFAVPPGPPEARPRSRAALLGASLLVALGLALHAPHLLAIEREGRRELRAFEQILARLTAGLGAGDRRPVFVVWGAALPYESVSPLCPPPALSALQTIPLSWSTHSPLYETMLRKHGIEDLHTALFRRDELYLIVPPGVLGYYEQFVREHYGQELSFERRWIAVPHLAPWGRMKGLHVVKPIASERAATGMRLEPRAR
jgi:hypothetical protein